MHRFIGDFNFNSRFLKIFQKDIYHQVKNVLKLKEGEKIILADGRCNEVEVKIVKFQKKFFEAEILEKRTNERESGIHSILYCSILKKENFEMVVQKATEVGVKEILPIICNRTVKLNFKENRLKKIIKEAAEQSGRGIVPILRKPLDFEKAILEAKNNSFNLFFDKSGEFFKDRLKIKDSDRIGIWVGPEGGWSEEELKRAKENDFLIINLGKLILRSETAAIVAGYLVSHKFL